MPLLATVKNYFSKVRRLIIPPFCAYCRVILEEDHPLCERCLGRIKPVVSVALRITKKKTMPIFAVSTYDAPLRPLVQAKNYGNRCASRQLGMIIWEQTAVRHMSFDIIVPIPLHWTRYAKRGFNQSEEIAHEISKQSGKPIIKLLERSTQTVFQVGLSRQERSENVKDVFSLSKNASIYAGKRILFIDDVMTTGATVYAASRAVGPLKPLQVMAAVACRVINN